MAHKWAGEWVELDTSNGEVQSSVVVRKSAVLAITRAYLSEGVWSQLIIERNGNLFVRGTPEVVLAILTEEK